MKDFEKLLTIKRVLKKYRDISEFDNKTRIRKQVQVRQEAHYFADMYTNYSLAEIGANLGEKNHATVLYSKRMIKDRISVDKYYREEISKLDRLIRQEFRKDPLTGGERRSSAADFIFNMVTLRSDIKIEVTKDNCTYVYHSESDKIDVYIN